MNKQDAIQAMSEGKKVVHRYFSDGEWMTMLGGKIMTEDEYLHIPELFWKYRNSPAWEDGYSLFIEPVKVGG